MNMLHPLEHERLKAAELSESVEGEHLGGTQHAHVQADVRFLRSILLALACITCLLGAVAVMAMP